MKVAMRYEIKKELKDPRKALAFAEHLIEGYLSPAFGARSKSEIDLLVFSSLIKAEVIDPSGALYDVARAFNVTPAKVRTLLLNWQLRDDRFRDDLTHPLREALQKTRFSKDGTHLTFGIESPLLKEEIVARLKESGVFADATFSKEIVRMPVDAFVEFLDQLVEPAVRRKFVERLVKDRQIADKSFKAITIGVLGKLGEKVAGSAGEAIVGDIGERLGRVLVGLLRGEADEAVDAAGSAVG